MPKNKSIQRKLMSIILMTCGFILLLTWGTIFFNELLSFRKAAERRLSTLTKNISSNSAAALAINSKEDATQILTALKAEPRIVSASLYDREGNLFSRYPDSLPANNFPAKPSNDGFILDFSVQTQTLTSYQPIMQGNRRLGTLHLKADLDILHRFIVYGGIALLAIIISLVFAYFVSRRLQKSITMPILSLAETAKSISDHYDYSVRAVKFSDDEIGLLTDTFNQMLTRMQDQNKEILILNQELEQKVIERTTQFEIVNKELEAFSYSVSHDLRAPLRAVNGYAKMLEEDYESLLDAEGKRLLSVIQKNARTMGTLIDDLLAFSRLGKTELNKSYIDMNDLAGKILEELPKSIDHPAAIQIHQLHPAFADRSSINQVFVNLISNAIKYSSRTTKPVVEIKSYRKDNKIIYSVSDNGAGFDNKYVDKLFGVFQRLHSNEEFEGTGVGLALVKRIITKHGGEVWASGEVNKGATFSFSLPDIQN